MEIKQQLRMSQQLVMTPQLQQAIRLLQMSRMELVEHVREELMENPVLEDGHDGRDDRETLAGSMEGGDKQSDGASAAEGGNETTQDATTDSKSDDVDWERYLENHANQAPAPRTAVRGDDQLPGIDQTLTRAEGLAEHVFWQIQMGDFLEEEMKFAALVIGNLNDDGYLKIDGLSEQEIVERLAEEAGLHPEDAEEVLFMMQKFDPIGVCSRSLKECLLVQARHFEMDDLVINVISDHIPDLERRAYSRIAKKFEVEVEEIYDVAQVIADLEPRPGRHYVTQEPRYITPDVYVHQVGDEYFVVTNEDGMPRLKISGYYRAAMDGDPQAKEYIKNKLKSAQWLIRSIDQRRKTILRVTECIVEKQREFFDKGVDFLKPMILRDVAETLEMHESTISRVTSNKYVSTPRGVFELKYFFNSAIRRDNQEDIASESVKQAIKRLIASENPKSPYSDQKLADLLKEDGIKIARRTVAKYREMLGILSSSKRKAYF